MPVISLHWFLPTSGDARTVLGARQRRRRAPPRATATARRAPADLDYLGADRPGRRAARLRGALTPTGSWCEDAWLTTAALTQRDRAAQVPRRVPARAALADARRADGGDLPAHLRRPAAAQRRHRRRRRPSSAASATASTRTSATPAPASSSTSARRLDGRAVRLRRRALPRRGRARARRRPTVAADLLRRLLAGGARASPPRHADVYLTWGEPPAQVAEKLDRVRELAAAQGRELRFGIRLHVIARDTVRGGVGGGRPAARRHGPGRRSRRAQANLRRLESEGQRRMAALHGGQHATASRSRRTCGPASGSSAAAPAPRWSAATRRSPTASPSTTSSGSTSSSSPATRTSRRPTGSARA